MAFTASHRFARISARKVRPLADLVRGKFVDQALDTLRFQPHRGARMLERVIQSAAANAQDPDQNEGQNISVESLFIQEVRVNGGPMLKRIQPRARGTAYGIKKRMSHIVVVLEEV
jgi:large subunit ribosomal protein L22